MLLALTLFAPEAYAQRGGDAGSGPFAGLAGTWSGSGTIRLASGSTEPIRCRATYAVGGGGNTLQQSLRCASDTYNFDLRGNVEANGGAISGSWTETTRNASGSISGRASGGTIQANVQGPTFSAGLSLATRGDRQNVSLRSQGTELSEVSIALTRASR